MNTLIINCGSSSQGFKVYKASQNNDPEVVISGKAKNVGVGARGEAVIEWKLQSENRSIFCDLSTHKLAAENIIEILQESNIEIDVIGHRFVHGGTLFERTTKVDSQTLTKLIQCFRFAPIHNPNSYSVIEVCIEKYPRIPQYAVFDTAFHSGMPKESSQYAIPVELSEEYGFRKYGFHGLSYQYVSAKAAELMGKPLESLKLIICHLGTGGSSVVAVKGGISLDTSMGFSPLPGLVMSTRSGDIDAEIVLTLVRNGYTPDQVSDILNNQSGLLGLSGYSTNLLEIIDAAEPGNLRCQLAYDVYAHRLKTYLGAYTWLLNGADAIIFTDDVGVKSWKLRQRVCSGVENLGIEIDQEKNMNAPIDRAELISGDLSRIQIWTIPTDEEIVIYREVMAWA